MTKMTVPSETMIPSLFLRASEVRGGALYGGSRLSAPGAPGAESTAALTPHLLVPQVRPGLEFVLEGQRCRHGLTCDIPACNCGHCHHDGCPVPVRAFEVVAGERRDVRSDGPVFLVGPSVCGNFYGLERHELRREKQLLGDLSNPAGFFGEGDLPHFDRIKNYLQLMPRIYGIEFRLGDEPVARVMREEMGL